MRFISALLIAYRDKYGEYPPRVVIGPDGTPWHSWRVLILEFEDPRLYSQYRFDEPWNGPHNSTLVNSAPPIFRCLLDNRPDDSLTSYLCVDPGQTDGPVKYILEARRNVPWSKPEDLTGLGEVDIEIPGCGWPSMLIERDSAPWKFEDAGNTQSAISHMFDEMLRRDTTKSHPAAQSAHPRNAHATSNAR